MGNRKPCSRISLLETAVLRPRRLRTHARLQVLHPWVATAAWSTLLLLPPLIECRWEPIAASAACPSLRCGVGKLLRRNDTRVYNRYIARLRLEFDAQLGMMHSPTWMMGVLSPRELSKEQNF